MNTLSHYDLAVITFIGQSTLGHFYLDIIRKYPEYKVMPSKSDSGFPTLEIPLEKAKVVCYFNAKNECYTCWIKLDSSLPESLYTDFCNQYFKQESGNHWTKDNRSIELVKEKEILYFVLT